VLNNSTPINGKVIGYNTVYWPAVAILPGVPLKITNVLADASVLPSGTTAITGTLSLQSSVAVPVTNPQQKLANVATSLALQVGTPTTGPPILLPVTFQEAYQNAFHASGTPTRFRAVLTNVPANVQVYASVNVTGGSGQAQLYSADCSGAGGSPMAGTISGGAYVPAMTNGTTAFATWVVSSENQTSIDNLTVSFLLQNATLSDAQKIQAGAVGSYAPVTPAGAACPGTDPSASGATRYRDFSVPRTTASYIMTKTSTSTMVVNTGSSLAKALLKPFAVSPDSTPRISVTATVTVTNTGVQPITNGRVTVVGSSAGSEMPCTQSGFSGCTNQGDGTSACSGTTILPGASVSCIRTEVDDPTSNSTGYSSGSFTSSQDSSDPSGGSVSGGTLSPPVLQVSYPPPLSALNGGATVVNAPFDVVGYAVDQFSLIQSVQISADGNILGNAVFGTTASPIQGICDGGYAPWNSCQTNPNSGFTYHLIPTLLGPGTHTITATATNSNAPQPLSSSFVPLGAQTSIMISVPTGMPATKVGVFRNGTSFLLDSNGSAAYEAGVDRFIPGFTGPGGFKTGDMPVTGDWKGDGTTRVGIYRSSTGEWFLDYDNNGTYDPVADLTYRFGGINGDMPAVGDWTGAGKSCIGIFRSGFFWVLDLNCNGKFDDVSGGDTAFPFGGVSGDVPVVGNWSGGKKTRVGVVRKYAPAGVPQGNPFFWVPDMSDADAGTTVALHQPDLPRCFAFGGIAGDVFVTGDWYNTGRAMAGVYRGALWVLDTGLPEEPQTKHNQPYQLSFGGAPTDYPVVGKW
jgi:hypothetical protein